MELVSQGEIQTYEWEWARRESLRGLGRSSFLLTVTHSTYDAFFNSEFGYRGQYAVSPDAGERANRALIDALTPQLLAYVSGRSDSDVALASQSLDSRATKVWIDEQEEDVQRELVQGVPSIIFERWSQSWRDLTGLVAPVGMRIEVKGGWLNQAGIETLDPEKLFRSRDIHEHGHT